MEGRAKRGPDEHASGNARPSRGTDQTGRSIRASDHQLRYGVERVSTLSTVEVSVSARGATPDKPQSWAITDDGGRDSRETNEILDRSIPGRMERPPEVEPMAAWRQ